jgi:hypothetical protein
LFYDGFDKLDGRFHIAVEDPQSRDRVTEHWGCRRDAAVWK